MLSMLPCFGTVGPVQQKRIVLGKSDVMGNGEVTLFELSRIPVWKDKRFCCNQHGQACVPLSSTGQHSSGLILILAFQTLSPASLPGPALGSMDK